MFVTECFHNKCFKLSTLHSVYIPLGCESDMILSVMTVPIDYAPMQDLSIDIKHMPITFRGYQYLLVIICDQTNFTVFTPLKSRDAQSVAEALIYRVIYLFGPPRQIICDEAAEFTSHIVQAILYMLNSKLKVISPYNHGSSKVGRQIKTVSDIIVKHLWDKGQMWPLFVPTAAYAIVMIWKEFSRELHFFYIVQIQ